MTGVHTTASFIHKYCLSPVFIKDIVFLIPGMGAIWKWRSYRLGHSLTGWKLKEDIFFIKEQQDETKGNYKRSLLILNLCCALQNEDNLSPLTILGGLGAKFSVGLFWVFFLFSMFGGGDSWSLRKVRNLCGIHNTHPLQQGAELLQNCPKFQFLQFQNRPKFQFTQFYNSPKFRVPYFLFLHQPNYLTPLISKRPAVKFKAQQI